MPDNRSPEAAIAIFRQRAQILDAERILKGLAGRDRLAVARETDQDRDKSVTAFDLAHKCKRHLQFSVDSGASPGRLHNVGGLGGGKRLVCLGGSEGARPREGLRPADSSGAERDRSG